VKDMAEKRDIGLKTKFLSILFVSAVIAITVCIVVFRDKVQQFGNFGYIGVFILCFICNATVLAPAPSLAVVVSAALALNPLFVALFGSLGTTLGEAFGYSAGYMGKNIVDVEYNKMARWVKKYGSPVIFVFALLPLPLFDVIGVVSGYLRIRLYKFLVACFLGKFIKMTVYALGAGYFVKYIN
jgi:membrane protein YqaA with SNARE-associated domain